MSTSNLPPLLPQTGEARLRELEILVEWQGDELSKRMACVNCGEEPHPDSELYSTVCPSCRMCFSCCEPMCPTCGDRDGTKQRAIDLRNENEQLRAEISRLKLSAGSAQAPETPPDMQLLAWAVSNCHTLARRELNRLRPYVNPDTLAIERWEHVQRICEKAGATTKGVLRAALPTEITDGASSSDEQAEGR